MTRSRLAIGVLLGVLSMACGRYGPPVRPDPEPARATVAPTEAASEPAALVEDAGTDAGSDEPDDDREEVQP